jgi:uncharacterized protein
LRSHQTDIAKFGAKRLGLFGSFVRNESTADSDIDFVVEFESGQKTYDNFIHLAYYLEALLDRKVELLTTESISRYIKPYIEREIEYVSFRA